MINITIDCATGAEAREQLVALLYGVQELPLSQPEKTTIAEKTTENFEPPKTEEAQPKKRASKAEKVPEVVQEEALKPTNGEDIQGEAKQPSAVTKEMLQEKAVSVIRNNKKPEVFALLKKFGADSISQADKNPLKVEHYSEVMDELNKL